MRAIREYIELIHRYNRLAEMTAAEAKKVLSNFGASQSDLRSARTVSQLRRKLNMKHHTDLGGNLGDVQDINAACDFLIKIDGVSTSTHKNSSTGGSDRADPFGFGFEQKPGRSYNFWGDDTTDYDNAKREKAQHAQEDREGVWAYAGLRPGQTPKNIKIRRHNAVDLNYIKRLLWLKGSWKRDTFVVTAYNREQGFFFVFACYCSEEFVGDMAGETQAHCESAGLGYPEAIFVSPDDGQTEIVAFLNGDFLDDPYRLVDGEDFEESIAIDPKFRISLDRMIASH